MCLEELIGLSGGKKHHWCNVHRQQIEDDNKALGEHATCYKYNLKPATLLRFLSSKHKDNHLTKADRAILRVELVEAGNREQVARIRELEGLFYEFVQRVVDGVGDKFIRPKVETLVSELPKEFDSRKRPEPLDKIPEPIDYYHKVFLPKHTRMDEQ